MSQTTIILIAACISMVSIGIYRMIKRISKAEKSKSGDKAYFPTVESSLLSSENCVDCEVMEIGEEFVKVIVNVRKSKLYPEK